MVCMDIVEIWLELLMGKFRQFLSALSAHNTSIFSFLDDNFSKYQCSFMKLGMSIDIVEIWFGIADGQISACDTSVVSFQDNNCRKQHIHIFVSS